MDWDQKEMELEEDKGELLIKMVLDQSKMDLKLDRTQDLDQAGIEPTNPDEIEPSTWARSQFHQNFTASFTHADPKSTKKTHSLTVFFAYLVSAQIKAAGKMLVTSAQFCQHYTRSFLVQVFLKLFLCLQFGFVILRR